MEAKRLQEGIEQIATIQKKLEIDVRAEHEKADQLNAGNAAEGLLKQL
jgi:hypothetical protein